MVYVLKAIITGGAGFIGHHIVERMVSEGYSVLVIDDLRRACRRGLRVLRELGVVIEKIDVTDYERVRSVMMRFKPDYTIHAAALIDVEESIEKPNLYMHVNAEGTASVAKASVEAGVEKIVYLSSAAVYGHPKHLPVDEEHPTNPISPYGASKLAGEYVLKTICMNNSVKHVILRLFNVYGPGQDPESPYSGVISRFIHKALRGEPLVIYGDGMQTRDFIYISDVVDAVILSMHKGSGVYNVGSGCRVRIIDLARSIIGILNSSSRITYAPPRPGDVRDSQACIERICRELGFKPKVDLTSGLKMTVAEEEVASEY